MKARQKRQVDVFVRRGDEVYLIEAKWWKRPVSIAEIDALRVRLEPMPASVVGVMVSYAGCSDEAIGRVEEKSERPIIVITGEELEQCLTRGDDFLHLVRRKKATLLVHGEMPVGDILASRRRRAPGGLTASAMKFVFPDGSGSSWLSCRGGFGQFTFTQELPDIDWVLGDGAGVSLDMSLAVGSESGLIQLIEELSGMGCITAKASWSIQQATRNWHGLGPATFVEALTDWKSRYADLDEDDVHHSEELCYFDVCDGGLYTLTANLSAYEPVS